MKFSLNTLVVRNISYHRRIIFFIVLSVALSSLIISGSFILGDSIEFSLKKDALKKIGKVEFIIKNLKHGFTVSDFNEIKKSIKGSAALLNNSKGIAVNPLNGSKINKINCYGIDDNFFRLNSSNKEFSIKSGEAFINKSTADALKLSVGDRIKLILNLKNTDNRGSPFSESLKFKPIDLKVKRILSADDGGDFSLSINTRSVKNIFYCLEEYDDFTGDTVLIADNCELTEKKVELLLENIKKFNYAGLFIKEDINSSFKYLNSKDIFIKNNLTSYIKDANIISFYSYLINSITFNGKATPYSFAAGLSSLRDLNKNEVIINSWLADDLGVKAGDTLSLSFYNVNNDHSLIERNKVFVIKKIILMSDTLNDSFLMPEFPGLSNKGNCYEWETQIPINLTKIREKDEEYWDKYQGTPKIYLSLNAAQKLFINPYGSLTGLKFSSEKEKEIRQKIEKKLTLRDAGIYIENIKETQTQSAKGSVDFAILFLSLGFIIIISSILLLILYFLLFLEKRSIEINTLKILGVNKYIIRKIFSKEGVIISSAGAVIGLAGGILYAKLCVFMLKNFWTEALNFSGLFIFIKSITLFKSFFITFLLSIITIYYFSNLKGKSFKREKKTFNVYRVLKTLNVLFLSIFLILIIIGCFYKFKQWYYLVAGLSILFSGNIYFLLFNYKRNEKNDYYSLNQLIILNVKRNLLRNFLLSFSLSSGVFIIFLVSLNTKVINKKDFKSAQSGTGGFDYIIETSYSCPEKIITNILKGKDNNGDVLIKEEDFTPFYKMDINDASCLNIKSVNKPSIIGLDIDYHKKRNTFKIKNKLNSLKFKENFWELLESKKNYIPAVADDSMIVWGLKKKLGDIIEYTSSSGEKVKIKLVASVENSILQGNLLINQKHFKEKFLKFNGIYGFLISINSKKDHNIYKEFLERVLKVYGPVFINAPNHLQSIYNLENTYLNMFMILGGLGIISAVGSLSVIILISAEKRRNEFAVLNTLGFAQKRIKNIFAGEFIEVIKYSISTGCAASFIGIYPIIKSSLKKEEIILSLVFILIVLVTGLLSIKISINLVFRKNILHSLRYE